MRLRTEIPPLSDSIIPFRSATFHLYKSESVYKRSTSYSIKLPQFRVWKIKRCSAAFFLPGLSRRHFISGSILVGPLDVGRSQSNPILHHVLPIVLARAVRCRTRVLASAASFTRVRPSVNLMHVEGHLVEGQLYVVPSLRRELHVVHLVALGEHRGLL